MGKNIKKVDELLENYAKKCKVDKISVAIRRIELVVSRYTDIKKGTFKVYLHGSIYNETNIKEDSDLDVIIEFYQPYKLNIYERLNERNIKYIHAQLYEKIFQALENHFGENYVYRSDKCIKLRKNRLQQATDILIAFTKKSRNHKEDGIIFYTRSHFEKIINYPILVKELGETKNIETKGRFNEIVRILKNIRSKHLLDIPSFFIQSLVYNIPNTLYQSDKRRTLIDISNYLRVYKKYKIMRFRFQHQQSLLFGIYSDRWDVIDLDRFLTIVCHDIEYQSYSGSVYDEKKVKMNEKTIHEKLAKKLNK